MQINELFAIDSFHYKRGVKYYLLSHPHSDHMQGLTKTWNYGVICCSPVTAALLQHRYQLSQERIVPFFFFLCSHFLTLSLSLFILVYFLFCFLEMILDYDHPKTIIIDEPSGTTCSLTAIDANHCPGSVMFLLQSDAFGTVLCTGDFRFVLAP